ncbi:Odorant receptor 46a, isoform A [Harpegnathos saltator]|uniref:Odorant receptor n=1 Tax=Harpegnathos saltator TaxID=610380 RepID=E2BWG1_HARSA|nr:Odorant receptor 46a, isoform A [Harpegnathos saltator]
MGGVWRPVEWTSSCAKLLNNVFGFCTIVPIYFLMLTQLMNLVFMVDNVDDFITNSLMFMTILAICCKATTAMVRRDVIIDLVQTLSREPCKPQDADELAIQTKFDVFIRSCSIKYSILATISLKCVTVRLALNAMQGILPYRAWLPYDSTLSLAFWITSIQQMMSLWSSPPSQNTASHPYYSHPVRRTAIIVLSHWQHQCGTHFSRSCSIKYSILATSSLSCVTIRSVLNAMQGILPYRAWLPYDSTLSLAFWITSIQQMISLVFATIISVGTETVVCGLFLQTCAQLEIFERRLHKLVIGRTVEKAANGQRGWYSADPQLHDKRMISGNMRHHLGIYEYAKAVNSAFNQILFVQFFCSILLLCTSVYYLSSHITEFATATLVIYTIGMFVQIYVYCWSGNEVILKSTKVGDAISHTDWPLLTISEQKAVLMIMRRSTIPIKFTSSLLITLSLQSYSNVSIATLN